MNTSARIEVAEVRRGTVRGWRSRLYIGDRLIAMSGVCKSEVGAVASANRAAKQVNPRAVESVSEVRPLRADEAARNSERGQNMRGNRNIESQPVVKPATQQPASVADAIRAALDSFDTRMAMTQDTYNALKASLARAEALEALAEAAQLALSLIESKYQGACADYARRLVKRLLARLFPPAPAGTGRFHW